jgi:hypothetical protein
VPQIHQLRRNMKKTWPFVVAANIGATKAAKKAPVANRGLVLMTTRRLEAYLQ